MDRRDRDLRPVRLLVRGATRRCPRCGSGGLFRRWVRMAEHCPRCGYRFEREEGFLLGVISLNIGICAALFVIYLAISFVITAPDPPIVPLTIGALLLMIVAPLVVYPFAKTLWAAVELIMRPLDVAEEADAMTYLSAQERGVKREGGPTDD